MPDWFELLTTAIQRDSQAVLVTVVAVGGSVPREVGATLVVSDCGQSGSIGGGNLEFICIRDALEMLANNHVRNCKQISLGPSLGQCCGGRVEVLWDLVTHETDWFVELTHGQHLSQGGGQHGGQRVSHEVCVSDGDTNTSWLCRSLDGPDWFTGDEAEITQRLCVATDRKLSDLKPLGHKMITDTAVLLDGDNHSRWICQKLLVTKPAVWVYGAGHVGQAVVSQLSLLECQVTLLDHRDEWQNLQPGLTVKRLLTDTPAEDAVSAPDNAAHVVMTYSHSLDFEICHALLKQGRFGWLGLIGSDTKRQTFINRFKQRGISEAAIERLRCPIGELPLESSKPALISLNLAAQLALHWEQTSKLSNNVND